MLPEAFIQELKYRNDIESVVSSYVQLKHSGKTFSGLCPFHSEKGPSFHVYPDTQSFFCFGCRAAGDVISFIQRIENLEYKEALQFLAKRAGMAMPDEVENDSLSRLKTRIREINRETARIFHQNLNSPAGRDGLNYLRSRGLSDRMIRRFGLGYSLEEWDGLYKALSAKGYSDKELIAAEVVKKRKQGNSCYDVFRGRVMFPILDLSGNVIGFGGREINGGGPKYLNSADTPVFKKSRNLFALNFAKNSKETGMILAEGYMDVIALHQAGFDNAVATLGTSLTSDQCNLIARYTDLVSLSYDSDGPGQSATNRAIELLKKNDLKIKVIHIPNAKDPDEFIKKFGAQRFRLLLEGSANSTEFTISTIRQSYDLDTDDGKMNCLKKLAEFLATIPSGIERDVYISRVATDFNSSKDALSQQVQSLRRRNEREKRRKDEGKLTVFAVNMPDGKPNGINEMQRRNNIKCAVAEDRLLAALVMNPDYFKWASQKIQPEDFVTDRNRLIAQVIYERLGRNLSVDLSFLGESLDLEAVSQLSRGVMELSGRRISPEEAEDYIEVLLQHKKAKTKEEISKMDHEEYARYMESITKGKASHWKKNSS